MSQCEFLILLESVIDDCSPEIMAYTIECLNEAGAKDAWVTPVCMKKGRLGQQISVLAHEDQTPTLEETTHINQSLLKESTKSEIK